MFPAGEKAFEFFETGGGLLLLEEHGVSGSTISVAILDHRHKASFSSSTVLFLFLLLRSLVQNVLVGGQVLASQPDVVRGQVSEKHSHRYIE